MNQSGQHNGQARSSTNLSPTLPSFPPPKPYLELRGTLCSCEAHGMDLRKQGGTEQQESINAVEALGFCCHSQEWWLDEVAGGDAHAPDAIAELTLTRVLRHGRTGPRERGGSPTPTHSGNRTRNSSKGSSRNSRSSAPAGTSAAASVAAKAGAAVENTSGSSDQR
jgi:hypothetical protein